MTPREPAGGTGIIWRKPSRSNAGNDCVEIASTPAGYLIRDSKNPAGPRLCLAPGAWTAFMTDVRNGRYEAQHSG